jgi:hypothetical protein
LLGHRLQDSKAANSGIEYANARKGHRITFITTLD